MGVIAHKTYNPAVAVTKATSALQALTALDTVNLRVTFTPTGTKVFVRLAGTLHGAATLPQILLGVLNGATAVMNAPPAVGGNNLAATSLIRVETTFLVDVAAGVALTWDAAMGVETLVAATGLKYGGPNNATANDAFGAFSFEVWEA